MVSSSLSSVAQRAKEEAEVRRRTKDRCKIKSVIMFYTYILRSINHPDQRYIGSTADLRKRLAVHNAGGVPHTANFRPWKVETYIAFDTEELARSF